MMGIEVGGGVITGIAGVPEVGTEAGKVLVELGSQTVTPACCGALRTGL